MKGKKAVVLIGHGATASDTPRELISELKRLEARRAQAGGGAMSAREAELDLQIRAWPRTAKTDPYRAGVEDIARALRRALPDRPLAVAYNEFCAPTVDEAIDQLVADGVREIALVSTMLTRGGLHSEIEIPEIVRLAKARHAGVKLTYVWPCDVKALAGLLASQVKRAEKRR